MGKVNKLYFGYNSVKSLINMYIGTSLYDVSL